MDFLKRHLFLILSAIVGLAGIALAVTGLNAMPEVSKELNNGKKLYDDLSNLVNRPVNEQSIEIEQRRIDATRADRDTVFNAVKSMQDYKPLVDNALPNGDENALRAFRRTYHEAMDKLLEDLVSGQPATREDIDAMEDKIVDEQYRAKEKGLDVGAVPVAKPEEGPPRTKAGVLTKAGVRKDAAARANIAAARKIRCYVTPNPSVPIPNVVPSLDYHIGMADTTSVVAPYPEDVWMAQVGYWIQKDAMDAIAAVNDEAAAEAKADGRERWVGMMPVKDIISIRVSQDYVISDEDEFVGAPASGTGAALPPTTGRTVFTGHISNRTYEVMQFTLKLVMDQRDIPKLAEKLTANTMNTLLRVAYSHVPTNRDMQGKIYGAEPVVLVVMDLETVMLGEVFRPLMPTAVCERLADEGYGMTCPEPPKKDSEDG